MTQTGSRVQQFQEIALMTSQQTFLNALKDSSFLFTNPVPTVETAPPLRVAPPINGTTNGTAKAGGPERKPRVCIKY